MATVGPDKRLNYYQMAGNAVINELASHPYGLTTPEAKRRLAQNGSNIVHARPSAFAYPGLTAQPWLIAMFTAGLFGALYTHNNSLAIGIVAFGLVSLFADIWREHTTDNLEFHIHQLLPNKATVRRNDQVKIIDAAELVIGDIVELEVGARVPADLRIVKSDHLITDEAALFASGHQSKYSHLVTSTLPLQQRHNQAFAGTTVVSGSGTGVVVATGSQLELGRILAQAEMVNPKRSAFLPALHTLARRFSLVALLWFAVVALAVLTTDIELERGALFATALISALLPVGVGLAFTRVLRTFNQRSKHLIAQRLHAVDRLASVNALIIDESVLVHPAQTVQSAYIGKQHYQPDGSSLQPHGALLNLKGKPVGKKALAELELFFDAIALSTQARLLAPDANHGDWHAHGDQNEAALVAFATQAGFDSLATRENHPFIGRNSFDHERQLTSTVHAYNKQQLVFVHGNSQSVLARTVSSSEGGHTRKLTSTDRERYADYIHSQTQLGNHVVAIAYRKLARQTDGANLHHDELEKDLVLLGLVSIGASIKPKTVTAYKALLRHNGPVIIMSNRPDQVATAFTKQLGGKAHRPLNSHTLAALDDTELLNQITSDNIILTHPTPEQKLRLVALLESTGHRVLLSGVGATDIPALRQASVSLCSNQAPGIVSDESDFILKNGQLNDIVGGINHGREISGHLRRILHSAITDHSLQLGLVLVSFGLYLAGHIPMVTTALLLLVATALQILPYSTIGDDANDRGSAPSAVLPHPAFINVILGLFAGLLVSGNFLYFFVREGLSPDYIDETSNLFLHAATLSFVSLVLCSWINIIFSRSQHSSSTLVQQLRNRTFIKIAFVSVTALATIVYLPFIQQVVGTRGLNVTDWLCVLLTGTIYLGIRLVAHSERRHSRQQLIALHQDVHGKDSPAQI